MKTKLPATSSDSVREFHALGENYIEETFRMFPTAGSREGRREFFGELEAPDERLYVSYEKMLRSTLARVENLPEYDFAGNDWLDRRALQAELRTEIWSIERQAFRRNPEMWASGALDSVYSLLVKHADDLSPVADAMISRLKKFPRYLDHAQTLLKNPVPLWAKLSKKSCDAAPSLFDAMRGPLLATKKIEPEKLDKLLNGAKSAIGAYSKHVQKLKTGKPGDFAVGKPMFEGLIRERLGWDLTADAAETMGWALKARIEAEMEQERKKFSSKKTAMEVLEDAAAQWKPSQGGLLEEYKYQTLRMREAFERADLVSFPSSEQLEVKLVPEFLRHHFPTAAYLSPGCFDTQQNGIFWVNDLSLTKTSEKDKLAEIQQHFALEATCAHEAYPGHHLQFVTANGHPSPLRRMFKHAIFYEGWTLWCEKMCVDFNILQQPTAKLSQLHDALWRANRIIIDCGLQTGKMSFEQAVNHLMKNVGFTRGRAEGDVNWYTASPTVPMSYLLGRTELLRVKKKKVDEGGWTVKQFNDWILSFGTLPWRWMEISGL